MNLKRTKSGNPFYSAIMLWCCKYIRNQKWLLMTRASTFLPSLRCQRVYSNGVNLFAYFIFLMVLTEEVSVAVTYWTCPREVLCSNVVQETIYSEVLCFSSATLWKSLLIHLTIRVCVVWDTDSVVKWVAEVKEWFWCSFLPDIAHQLGFFRWVHWCWMPVGTARGFVEARRAGLRANQPPPLPLNARRVTSVCVHIKKHYPSYAVPVGQLRRVTANVLKKKFWTTVRRWSCSFESGLSQTTPHLTQSSWRKIFRVFFGTTWATADGHGM
jgi:hypothetical protein